MDHHHNRTNVVLWTFYDQLHTGADRKLRC